MTIQKQAMRRRILTQRRDMTPEARRTAAAGLADVVLGIPEIASARMIASYVSMRAEPSTDVVLDRLLASGTEVLLPVLLPDADLDWARYAGRADLFPSPRGILEPAGERLGVSAVARAQAMIVPAVAVDRRGYRLGRGGGSYDRVLSRISDAVFTVAALFDGEVVDTLPTLAHDQRVHAAATPTGLRRFD
jgi:5-formyltetrahydrofolate cyclo-ligase